MLPHPLLDLVSLRLSTRRHPAFLSIHFRDNIQRIQRLATQSTLRPTADAPLLVNTSNRVHTRGPSSIKARQLESRIQVISELQACVDALKHTTDRSIQAVKVKNSDSQFDSPYYKEATLQDIYKDLLASPSPKPSEGQRSPNTETISAEDILHVLRKRLPEFEAAVRGQAETPEGLSTRLWSRVSHPLPHLTSECHLSAKISEDIASWESRSPLRELICRLRVVLELLQTSWGLVKIEFSTELRPAPFCLLSNAEWHALSEACLLEEDPHAAEIILKLMKSVGLSPADEQFDMILNYFAEKGLVEEAERYYASLGLDSLRECQRDCLIKARVKAGQIDEACTLLHTYETRKTPAPIKSYTRIIQTLLRQRGPGSAQQSAQAWDLFAHMRYVAHPVPDAFLYSTMIRASPEPERALDLFTEMTVEQRLVPDAHAYTAVIRACARSKGFALHAFRILREMLNSHRDAHGQIPTHLRPNMYTFLGLLDAAKRMGDLRRARWVLAEMSRGALDVEGGDGKLVYVNENALTHMFHAYAAYQTPFLRGSVPLAKETTRTSSDNNYMDDGEESLKNRGVQSSAPPRLLGVPQTSSEVIYEVAQLWKRVLTDREAASRKPDSAPPPLFSRVQLDSNLLNAYLSVHFAHSTPSRAYEVYDKVFGQFGIERDAFTYVIALEAFAKGNLKLPRSQVYVALARAREIWKEWSVLENGDKAEVLYDVRGSSKVEARLVERAWSAMIRLLTLTGNIDEAELFLRDFVRRYPPQDVKQPSPPDPRRSNRTQLYAERPLIRLMEPSAVPEDRISPFLTFTDLAVLHHGALRRKMMLLVGYLKWVVSAYEGALRRRREAQLQGK